MTMNNDNLNNIPSDELIDVAGDGEYLVGYCGVIYLVYEDEILSVHS